MAQRHSGLLVTRRQKPLNTPRRRRNVTWPRGRRATGVAAGESSLPPPGKAERPASPRSSNCSPDVCTWTLAEGHQSARSHLFTATNPTRPSVPQWGTYMMAEAHHACLSENRMHFFPPFFGNLIGGENPGPTQMQGHPSSLFAPLSGDIWRVRYREINALDYMVLLGWDCTNM